MPSSFPHVGCFDASAAADIVTAFIEKSPTSATAPQSIGSPISPAGYQNQPVLITASGAINASLAANYVITKAGIAVMTIAAPVTGTDDGKIIEITNNTANQHTVTFSGGTLISGAAGVTTATFPVSAGACIRVMAMTAKWILLSNNLVVIT